MEKILIADDEPSIRKGFASLFEAEGYAVRTARDGVEAVEKFQDFSPDLVLLDVMMPRKNGLAACEEIRRLNPLVPILFFTAVPSEVSLVRGLGQGADDYIDKARSPEEFLARVKTALRRQQAAAASRHPAEILRLASVTVDFSDLSVRGDGLDESLTKSEVQFLRLLASDRGRVYSFDDIFSALRGKGYVGADSAIHAVVSRLKAKLGRAGELIVNEIGQGYRLV